MLRRSVTGRCDERGATAVEYGLMMSFMALAIVAGVTKFGASVSGLFQLIPSGIWP